MDAHSGKRSRTTLDLVTNVATFFAVAMALFILMRRELSSSPIRSAGVKGVQIEGLQSDSLFGTLSGGASPSIRIIEIADFQCPACRRFHATMLGIEARYRDTVSRSLVHFPLSYHQFAVPAAIAAECANRQGRFREMRDRLFESQDSLGLKPFVALAKVAHVGDTLAFASCLAEADASTAVEAGVSFGRKAGVSFTPTIIVNGWRLEAVPDSAELVLAIERIRRYGSPNERTFAWLPWR